MSRPRATRCRHRARHWFTYYGWVGSSAPACRACGATNPNYRPEDDPFSKATWPMETVSNPEPEHPAPLPEVQ